MTRQDIGSYLGLALQTVSRALSRFRDQGFIQVENKRIRILDCHGLKNLIEHASEGQLS
jgi:CRP/FNR family transcriptional regulator